VRTAAIALGSNEGDRPTHIDYAVGRLQAVLDGVRVSRYVESPPAPPAKPEDPRYLNAVLVGRTALDARGVLDLLMKIERERGRIRPRVGAPRTLDLDLILLGDVVMKTPGLEIPHPRFRERRFVLEPLAQVAPDLVDPVTRCTIVELLERAAPRG
jgi:2-amino-4-hydroxy-6-hydroxymethyldihydropteridine diphosphokinase